MIELKLSNSNLVALIDDSDFDLVKSYTWTLIRDDKRNYVAVWLSSRRKLYLHNLLMKESGGDHIDGNGLNNQRSNLRSCDNSQNMWNRRKLTQGTSKYKGVRLTKEGKWMARIKKFGKEYYLGIHTNEIDAAKAYDSKAIELFGNFANLNFKHERLNHDLPNRHQDTSR